MKPFPGARLCSLIVVFLLCSGLAPPGAAPFAAAFPDTHGHWAAFYIDHFIARGLIAGYPDGTFKPQDSISRAEFTTLLVSVLHQQDQAAVLQAGRSSYSDCQGLWAQGSIEFAHEMGYVYGVKGSLFEPERDTTRQEAAVILALALDCGDENLPVLDFTDVSQISPDARKHVACAMSKGLITGLPDGSFRPGDPLSRAQVAVIMNRFLATRGEDFDFYGVVKSVDDGGRLHIMTGGSEQAFDLARSAVIYDQDRLSYAVRIPLESAIYFDVDPSGMINFACLCPPAGRVLSLNYVSLPDYQVHSSPGDRLSLAGTEDDEAADENAARADLSNPGSSLDACRRAMKADLFMKETGASGSGQLIAVIDSGVDPGHPDLQSNEQGQPKLLDYIDLTSEGRVELSPVVADSAGLVKLSGVEYKAKGITSVDKIYRLGVLPKSAFPADFAADFTDAGLAVMAVCSSRAGNCDYVYADLDGDRSFSDENPLPAYSAKRQFITLTNSRKARLNMVVADLDKKGSYLKMGFDGQGHGTIVAGVAAAAGVIKGIAPDATILPVKIVNRAGSASVSQLKEAVIAAGERGARIAVISLGQGSLNSYQRMSLENLALTVREKYGMILVMAAGNNGPGLESVNDSSDLSSIISVGAYATPEMWKNDYGWDVKSPTLWYFSPAGPGSRAGLAPLLVAPGSAVSCYPQWSSESYRLMQGTSIAAPSVAGALALLLEASPGEDYRLRSSQARAALLNGTSPLQGFQPVEQGYGAIDMMQAWDSMKKNSEIAPDLKVSQASPGLLQAQGLYTRGLAPGQFNITLTNESDNLCQLMLTRAARWVAPAQNSLQLPANSSREIGLDYSDLETSGLYSALLVADDAETLGFDAVAMQTVVIPVRLDQLPGKTVAFGGELGPGLFQRYFVEAPEGSTSLDLNLDINGQGRVRLYLISPDGQTWRSDYVGKGSDQSECNLSRPDPCPGIWEAVVYSSAALSEYGISRSGYSLTASLKKSAVPPEPLDRKYLVSCLPSSLLPNIKQSMVTLRFWQPDSKLEASGIVAVNGRLYQIHDGMVQLDQPVDQDMVSIQVGW